MSELADQLENAVQILKQDGVVAMPTETVYGLAARIGSATAIEKIFLH
jgi:tRNA A37 threonylcarbamoyladenosine synthetase subunit TsaC/SUA5/YrdC